MRNYQTESLLGVGMLAGGIITALILAGIPGGYVRTANIKKAECERSLPRNQTCVMEYVPGPIKAEVVKPTSSRWLRW